MFSTYFFLSFFRFIFFFSLYFLLPRFQIWQPTLWSTVCSVKDNYVCSKLNVCFVNHRTAGAVRLHTLRDLQVELLFHYGHGDALKWDGQLILSLALKQFKILHLIEMDGVRLGRKKAYTLQWANKGSKWGVWIRILYLFKWLDDKICSTNLIVVK